MTAPERLTRGFGAERVELGQRVPVVPYAAGVREQHPVRDGHVVAGVPDREGGRRRDVVVEPEGARLPDLHQRRGRERLGDGADEEHGVLRDGAARADVGEPVRLAPGDGPPRDDAGGEPRHVRLREPLGDGGVEVALPAARGRPDRAPRPRAGSDEGERREEERLPGTKHGREGTRRAAPAGGPFSPNSWGRRHRGAPFVGRVTLASGKAKGKRQK